MLAEKSVLIMVLLFLYSRPFANLHIAYIVAIDDKTNGCADLMEPVYACGSGIDVQKLIHGVVDYF